MKSDRVTNGFPTLRGLFYWLAKLRLEPMKHDPVLVRRNWCIVKFDPIVKPSGK